MRSRLIMFARVFGITFLRGALAALIGGAIYGGALYPFFESVFMHNDMSDFIVSGLALGAFFGGLFGIAAGVVDGIWLGWLVVTILAAPHQSTAKRWALQIASAIATIIVTEIGLRDYILPIVMVNIHLVDFIFYYGLPMLIAGIGGWWVANRVIASGQVKRKRKKNDGTVVEPITPQTS